MITRFLQPIFTSTLSRHRKLVTAARPVVNRAQLRTSSRWTWAGLFTAASISLALLPRPVHLDAEPKSVPKVEEEMTVDPATSIAFPNRLKIPSKIPLPTYTLIGLGVRKVSFLRIKVYSVGFYADLDNPDLNIPKTATADEKIEHIVRNTSCVIRIIPTRSTSYTHLRDAFMRSLHARMQRARQTSSFSASDELSVQAPMLTLKSLFPNSSFAKHTPLDILLSPPAKDASVPRVLIFRDLGAVKGSWVATELVLAYFDANPPSPALKQSVMVNLESFGQ